MKMKLIFLVVILLCIATIPANILCEDILPATLVKQRIEKFIAAEFEGDTYIRDESDLVQFNPNEQKSVENSIVGACIMLDISQLMIVTSYKIGTIVINNNNASVTVIYRRIARTAGLGLLKRKIIPELVEAEKVRYKLIYKNNSWFVYDPPLPRVSIKAMVAFYEDEISRMGKFIHDVKTSPFQKRVFQKADSTLEVLKNLPD